MLTLLLKYELVNSSCSYKRIDQKECFHQYAGGLIEESNGNLTMDIQSNGGLKIDRMTIMAMMRNKVKLK
jgi:hypothetical protein